MTLEVLARLSYPAGYATLTRPTESITATGRKRPASQEHHNDRLSPWIQPVDAVPFLAPTRPLLKPIAFLGAAIEISHG